VVIAPEAALREILERDGQPILRKGIEGLLGASDASRHISMLFAPSYLLSDGRSLLPGNLEKLGPSLERIFGMHTQAVLASAHLDNELFLELRVAGPADVRPQQLAIALRDELETAGQQVEEHVTSLTPQPYGRSVIHRFPRMLQLVGNFTRAAAEGRQAVLRCYLPTSAAHNLALGAELTLQETIGASAVAQDTSATPMGRGAAAALDRVVSLSFPRDTLEHSLELLAAEIDTPIVIEGTDLQLEGITKNQSLGLDERDKPARQILSAILKLANAEGKLTYVIRTGEGLAESIHVTTRAGAARRGERLPAEMDEKSPAKSP
jgi:hypothetical protein